MEEAHGGFDWESMTAKCIEALVLAQREAEFLQAPDVGTEHVLIGLLSCDSLGSRLLEEAQVDAAIVRATLEKFRSRERSRAVRPFSWRVRAALQVAFEEARSGGQAFITTDHLFVGLLGQEESGASRILADLQAPVGQILAKLRHGHARAGEEDAGSGRSLDVDSFLEALEELGRALQAAQRVVESLLPHAAPLPAIRFPEIDESWPVVDERVYPIGRLVRQILAGAVLRRATSVTFEPQGGTLRLEFHLPADAVETVEVPGVLCSVLPFRIMRMARLDPMDKSREQEGRLVFRYRRQAYPMTVRSEPVHRGLRVVVELPVS